MGAKLFAKKEANRRTDKRNRVKEVQTEKSRRKNLQYDSKIIK